MTDFYTTFVATHPVLHALFVCNMFLVAFLSILYLIRSFLCWSDMQKEQQLD